METNYSAFRERQQSEVNALPLYFAFGSDQFNNLLKKLNLTEKDANKELTMIEYGAIIRKSDLPNIRSVFKRHREETEEAFKNMDFFKSAVIYEMRNHEYAINYQGDYDVINALGFNTPYSDGKELDDCKMTPEQKNIYREARHEYYRIADENEWY